MNAQDFKNSILQLAVQGKLVEQHPEEGTAKELLEQIKVEKEQLIKDKKIKKEKPLPEITEEEIPFEIPESWEWVRISDVFNVKSAMRIHQTDWKTEGIPFFRGRELVQLIKTGNVDFEIYISRELYEKNKEKGGIPKKNDILVTAVGTIGKSYIVQGTQPFYYKDAYILCFENIGNIYPNYIKWCLDSPYLQNEINRDSMATTVAQLTIMKAKELWIPFPPLEEQKRIVAKIEEILPYIEQYDKAYTRLETFNKKFPEDMKKSILQFAMQGKLVEQRPEEGTAEELYKQIVAEKERLIKEGKIKKEKPLEKITIDEIPFEIPKSWKWVRLGELSKLITKGSSPSWQGIKYCNDGLLFVTSENVGKECLLLDNPKYVEERFNDIQERSILQYGDILTNLVGASIGRTAIYNLHQIANINQAVCIIRLVSQSLNEYILKYMNSYVVYKIMMDDKVDTARANISLANINNVPVPLPPLDEQKRIVAKLEQLLPYCDQLIK